MIIPFRYSEDLKDLDLIATAAEDLNDREIVNNRGSKSQNESWTGISGSLGSL